MFKLTLAKLILDYIEADFFHFFVERYKERIIFKIKTKFLLKVMQKGDIACTLLNTDGLLNKIYTYLKKDWNDDIEEEECKIDIEKEEEDNNMEEE